MTRGPFGSFGFFWGVDAVLPPTPNTFFQTPVFFGTDGSGMVLGPWGLLIGGGSAPGAGSGPGGGGGLVIAGGSAPGANKLSPDRSGFLVGGGNTRGDCGRAGGGPEGGGPGGGGGTGGA